MNFWVSFYRCNYGWCSWLPHFQWDNIYKQFDVTWGLWVLEIGDLQALANRYGTNHETKEIGRDDRVQPTSKR